ncbi:MAG: hypothetical protein A3H51_02720, partial [Candidatus Spechtbacteria bacterium RIFCSPLOWO2_02_FULL_38_8]
MIFNKKFNKFIKNIEYHSDKPRVFTMVRKKDENGISGRGRVLDGVIFEDGKTVISWRSAKPSIAIYNSFEEFKQIHIDSHP